MGTMGSQVFRTIENQIGEMFAAEQVDRAKLGIAVGALGRANAYNFKNRLVNDQLSGVKMENLEGVGKFVCSKLGLKDPAICTKIKSAFLMIHPEPEVGALLGGNELEEYSLDWDVG